MLTGDAITPGGTIRFARWLGDDEAESDLDGGQRSVGSGRERRFQRKFWADVWPEAARDLGRGGVRLEITHSPGEVGKPDGRQPVITGLRRDALNLVVTDQVPME